MQAEYESVEYCDLMTNATFVIVPGGRSPASYRFLEALRSGAIPVLFYEREDKDLAMPYEHVIKWKDCVGGGGVLVDIVWVEGAYEVGEDSVRKMQEACRSIYEKYFETEEKRLGLLLQQIARMRSKQRSFL